MKGDFMSIAKRDSDTEIGHLDTFDIQADLLFYRVNGKDREMQDIEAAEDFSLRLKVHFQRCKRWMNPTN